MSKEASAQTAINFQQIVDQCEAYFPLVQTLNLDGEVINQKYDPDLSDEEALELMKLMVFARTFDKQTNSYAQQARMGFYASSYGQEAAQMASSFAFDREDWLYGGYRDIPQLLQHGASIEEVYHWSKGHVKGSQYAFNKDVKAALPQIIIGAQMIQAQGNAYGQKLRGSKQVTYAYTGDGGTSEGDTYEALNFAGVYQSPIIFYFQNNGYAISTPTELQTHAKTFAQKAIAAGIPGIRVDGNDALATYFVSKNARDYAANGHGPIVIELVTNRLNPHSTMGDDPLRYREQTSIDEWTAQDPLIRYRKYLTKRGILTPEMEEQWVEEALEDIKAGMEASETTPLMQLEDSFAWQYHDTPKGYTEGSEAHD